MSATADQRVLVLHHADCADGFAAAWVAWRALGRSPGVSASFTMWPVAYGTAAPTADDVAGRAVFILDFCYPEQDLLSMTAWAERLVVLDHHASAAATLARVAEAYPPASGRFAHIFDTDHSGARLAWDWFCPGQPVPRLIHYVEDADLYRFRLPHARAVSAYLSTYPLKLTTWDFLAAELDACGERLEAIHGPVRDGLAVLRHLDQRGADVQAHARDIELAGAQVRCANVADRTLISDVGQALARDRPFSVTWFQRRDGLLKVSLRSTASGVDVSRVAALWGGGGHVHSAGFEAPPDSVVARTLLGVAVETAACL